MQQVTLNPHPISDKTLVRNGFGLHSDLRRAFNYQYLVALLFFCKKIYLILTRVHKPHPIFRPKWSKSMPFRIKKKSKTIPFGAAHNLGSTPPLPSPSKHGLTCKTLLLAQIKSWKAISISLTASIYELITLP